MRKSLALTMAITLVGGLFASALVSTANAGGARVHDTEFTAFRWNAEDGKFVGRIAGKRYLCLDGRDVVIFKKVDGSLSRLPGASGEINVGSTVWRTFGEGKFSIRHPAMSITNKRKRNRALRGEYVAKYLGGAVAEYGRDGECGGSKSESESV